MAIRPVFITSDKYPYVKKVDIEFEYFGGFAVSQKQKCITSLHKSFSKLYENKKVLEVSSASYQEKGTEFSAFVLKKYIKELDTKVPVENIFQSAKVFENGGPYKDLLLVMPIQAKKDQRIRTGTNLVKFTFEGNDYPLIPRTIFYDWIYMNALLENKELIQTLIKYDAFTDIEFNPNRSINCQAKTCATFVSLYKLGLMNRIKDFDDYYKLMIGE